MGAMTALADLSHTERDLVRSAASSGWISELSCSQGLRKDASWNLVHRGVFVTFLDDRQRLQFKLSETGEALAAQLGRRP